MLRLHRRQPTKPGVAHAPDAANEAALVARAKRDRLAFEPLYRTYLGPVYGYCYRRLGSPHAAETPPTRCSRRHSTGSPPAGMSRSAAGASTNHWGEWG